ncbi:MAG: hypothetical protein IH822_03310 [Chloroflexi bacterium]|nr:hypothetical protein [Chloroflexota bacterium]
MNRRPRPTRWWQGQAATLKTEIGHLFDDPMFLAGFDTAVAFSLQAGRLHQAARARAANLAARGEFGDAAILRGQGRTFVAKIREMAQAHLSALVTAATSAAPTLRQSLGEEGLTAFLGALVASVTYGAAGGGREEALALLEKMAPDGLDRLPGNPIGVVHHGEDGSLLLNVPAEATREHHLGIASYEKSCQPEGKPGRPEGSPKVKGAGRRPFTKEEKADALTLQLPAWAARHRPRYNLEDRRQAEAARSCLDRARSAARRSAK